MKMKSNLSAIWSISKAPLRRKCTAINNDIKLFQSCKSISSVEPQSLRQTRIKQTPNQS